MTGTLSPELACLIPVSLLLKESLIRVLWRRPTFLLTMKTRSPDGDRDREGGKTRFRITAPPLVFQFHLALPHAEDTNGSQEKRKCSLFMSTWTLWNRQDTRTFPHPPPTYRCSSPAQGLSMLHLDPLLQREIGLVSTQISPGWNLGVGYIREDLGWEMLEIQSGTWFSINDM